LLYKVNVIFFFPKAQRRHPVKHAVSNEPSKDLNITAPTRNVESVNNLEVNHELMQSLSIVPQSTEERSYSSFHEETAKKLEEVQRDMESNEEDIRRLGGILNAVIPPISDIDVLSGTERELATVGVQALQPQTNDAYVDTATSNISDAAPHEQFTIAIQPDDTVKPAIADITIAGEIVGTGPSDIPESNQVLDSSNNSTSPLKKQKRQLAAAFMNN